MSHKRKNREKLREQKNKNSNHVLESSIIELKNRKKDLQNQIKGLDKLIEAIEWKLI